MEEIAKAIIFICNNPEIRKQGVMVAFQKLLEILGSVMNKRYFSLYNDIIFDRSPWLLRYNHLLSFYKIISLQSIKIYSRSVFGCIKNYHMFAGYKF